MKNLRLILLLLLTVTACLPDKVGKKDPEPELAGTYRMTNFVSDGVTLIPRQGVSGTVNVVKNNDTQLSVSFSVSNANTGQSSTSNPEVVTIRKSGGAVYELVENGARIGSVDGTNFSLNYSTSTGSVTLTATK